MGKRGRVCYNGIPAGVLERTADGFTFTYDAAYLAEDSLPPISLSLPKRKAPYASGVLFPFFYGLLAEGEEKALQCALLKIDEDDHFTRLLQTAGEATIGAITIKEDA